MSKRERIAKHNWQSGKFPADIVGILNAMVHVTPDDHPRVRTKFYDEVAQPFFRELCGDNFELLNAVSMSYLKAVRL